MSGYTTAATLIANAMHQAYQEGVNLDEMFGVLSVQKEVTAVHLAQAALHQQAALARQAQEQANKPTDADIDWANPEVEPTNAN
jgi:hypothetical protein